MNQQKPRVWKAWALASVLSALLVVISSARAEDTGYLPVQGYLTDAEGAAIDGKTLMRFRLYSTPTPSGDEAEILFEEEAPEVQVVNGFFTVYLGDIKPLSVKLFHDHKIVFVGIRVGGDSKDLSPLLQLGTAPFAAYSATCGDADSVGGASANDLREGVPGLGSIVPQVAVDLGNGTSTLDAMKARGYALCDGTTPRSQGITNAHAAFIDLATPNLNGGGRFLRGGTEEQSGNLENASVSASGLTVTVTDPGHDHISLVSDSCNYNNRPSGGDVPLAGGGSLHFRTQLVDGNTSFPRVDWTGASPCPLPGSGPTAGDRGQYGVSESTTGISVAIGGGASETKPANMRVVYMIRVR